MQDTAANLDEEGGISTRKYSIKQRVAINLLDSELLL